MSGQRRSWKRLLPLIATQCGADRPDVGGRPPPAPPRSPDDVFHIGLRGRSRVQRQSPSTVVVVHVDADQPVEIPSSVILTVVVTGSPVDISGGGASQLFDVTGGTLTMSGLTLSGGEARGATGANGKNGVDGTAGAAGTPGSGTSAAGRVSRAVRVPPASRGRRASRPMAALSTSLQAPWTSPR